MKLLLKLSYSLIILCVCNSAFSQQTFIRELHYETTKNETFGQARVAAINEIKRALSDELGSYIVSESSLDIKNSTDDFEQTFVNKTRSLSLSLMKVKILEENRKSKSLYIKAQVKVDDNQLSKDLALEGSGEKSKLLQVVFELLKKNNVGATSIIVLNNTDYLLRGLRFMENTKTSKHITDVRKNAKGQVLEGKEVLNGEYKIQYSDNNYATFSLQDGYINGLFQLKNNKDLLLLSGEMKANKQFGLWEYRMERGKSSYLYKSVGYKSGLIHGEVTEYDIKRYNELRFVTTYVMGTPIKKTIYSTYNSDVFSGPVNNYGKKEGEWITKNKEGMIISHTNWKDDKKEGKYIWFHKNGKVGGEGECKNDKDFGKQTQYFKNGQIKSIQFYDDKGELTGKSTSYYSNGQIELIENYDGKRKMIGKSTAYYLNGQEKYLKDSKKEGGAYLTVYYENGQIKKEQTTNANDRKEGAYKEFYDNGKIAEEAFYKDGKMTGLHKKNNKNGAPILTENLKIVEGKSIKHGDYKEYNKGQLRCHYNFKNDNKDGLCIDYQMGTKHQETLYKDKLTMSYKEYFSNGVLAKEHIYPHNGKAKVEKQYYQNGQLCDTEYYNEKGDKSGYQTSKSGEYKKYSKDGTLIIDFNFNNGKLEGKCKEYFETGELKKSAIYVKGKLEGEYKEYLNPSTIKKHYFYKNGKPIGVCIDYDDYTKRRKEQTYKNDRIVYNKETFDDGRVWEYTYPFGGKPSILKKYYSNGQLHEIEHHKAPENKDAKRYANCRVGEQKKYSKKGILISDYKYSDGKRNGRSKEYYDNGENKLITDYVNGKSEGLYASFNQSSKIDKGGLSMVGQQKNGKRAGKWLVFLKGGKVREFIYDDKGTKKSTRDYIDASAKGKALKTVQQ